MLKIALLFLMTLLAPIPWLVTLTHLFVLKNKKKIILRILAMGLILWGATGYFAYKLSPKVFEHSFNNLTLKIIGVGVLLLAAGIEWLTQKELGTYRLMGSSELGKKKDKLVSTGIYAYARHPRYVEHPLWFLGLGLVTGYGALLWFALYLFLALWVSSYFEEKELIQRYGRAYLDYKNRTPAFFISPKSLGKFKYLV